VVEVHGGTLELVTSASGGAAFKMWLPVQDGQVDGEKRDKNMGKP
jgi:hypothetical protein